MKRILITGAAGFIGFHVATALRKQGAEVVGYDNFNPYYCVALKRARASALAKLGVEMIEGDLCDREHLAHLFEKYDFTHVLNLAAQAGVRYAQTNPSAYVKSNLEGFCTLLEQLKTRPQTAFVYASSSSVYGCNEKTPFSTTDPTERPANLYAATKKANELLAYSYHHLYGLNAVGLRYFTVYGPWGRPDMAYYAFTEAILKGEPIRLFNRGAMQRDFTYIDDAVAGTLAALDYNKHAVFNIGNNRTEELLTFVSILERELGQEGKKILVDDYKGEMLCTSADISAAQQELNFHPKTSLEEGLKNFIAWHKRYREGGFNVGTTLLSCS